MEKATMKDEAISRMMDLGIEPAVIEHFKQHGNVFVSRENGILSRLLPDEEALVKEWEDETGGLVFHVLSSQSDDIGRTLEYLFVSKYEEDWPVESRIRRSGDSVFGIYGYSHNIDNPMFSDFGNIWMINFNGVLVRVG